MASELTDALFSTYSQHPRAAILMSGAGSNATAILSNPELRELYDIGVVATDNPNSNAGLLAAKFGITLLERPAVRFANHEERSDYFKSLAEDLTTSGVNAVFYAGFMKITSSYFCAKFPGINVHPADLRINGADGLPKYRGMYALPMMRADLGFVRSTVHVVDALVDSGTALAVSKPVTPRPEQSDEEVHQMLKPEEHKAFTHVLRLLGKGMLQKENIPLVINALEDEL